MPLKLMITLFGLVAAVMAAQSLPEMRMTPTEMSASALDSNQIGSSGVAGVHTKVLFGDPAKAGFYTILLFVPAHTTATIAWPWWSPASGTSAMAIISR
jgi:hypothetical protein